MASADRLIDIFTEAKARPVGAERDHFLSEACREAPELQEQVLALLQAHDGAGDYLKNSIAPSNAFLTEKPGDKIGRYKLLQQIGEGGCGVVYMAEQEEPVRRRVALKVIKLGMDTKSVIARFEAERQALALMDHPNIAKVFEAGATDTGRPFFVMELVRGIKITDYCDENNLSTEDRLSLFTQVCQAVQHAHQKGVIHRDLKPSNILVTQHDNVAVPKVIDFGLAKATNDQRLTDKTLFTAFDQFVGTPAYMSPEQAQMSGLDVDTRTDIYEIAALALPDLHLGGPWNPWPADTVAWEYDEAHALYARTDRQGNCSVRRVADDVELHHLPGQDGTAALVFSRDGKYLAVHHTDSKQAAPNLVHLWHLEGATAQRLLAEEHARSPVFRDSKQFALAYADGSIRVFELPSGRQINRLAPDTLTREIGMARHPTEPVVAVWSYFELVVQIRDLETGQVLASLPQTDSAVSAAWHPDGRTLAVGYGESTVARLYDRATWKVQRTFEVGDFGKLVAFNHRGDRLLMRGWGGMLELFDVGTGQKVWSMAHNSTDRFSRDDGRLAGAGRDGKLGIWKVADAREYRTLVFEALPDKGEYFPGAISPDGRLLAVPVTDGIGFWDLTSGGEVARLAMKGRAVRVLFEPSGSLLTLSREGLARWPVASAPDAAGHLQIGPAESLPLPDGSALDQSRDGKVIVTCDRAVGSQQRHAGGWILHTDRPGPPLHLDPGADTYYIAVSPDGRWVFTVNHIDGGAKIWDARDGRMVRQFASGGIGSFTYGSSCFSPDSRWLRSGGDGNRLLAVGTWEPGPQVVSGFPTFAPDSRLMAVATSTGLQLFDSTTSRKVAMLEDPTLDATIQALFVPDGTKVLAVTKARGIHVWDLRLIRQRLKELGLDWDWPDFPPETK